MIGKAHETTVRDTTITWGEMGDGYPLVLLHGILDSHRAWRRVAPQLARHFRVLMPDLPGHGYSGRPDAPYTLTWYADVIAAWMEAVGVEKAHICGHSYGGGVAQWMVLEQRERIDRLALVSAGGLGRGVAPGMRFATFPMLGPLLTPSVMRLALPTFLRLTPALFGYMEPEEQERYIAMRRIPGSDMAFRRTVGEVINFFGQYMQTIQRVDEVEEMPPVAIFWGAKDPVIPVRHGKDATAQSEGITLTVYKGCGHSCHLDAPERFATDLTDFLLDPNRRPARFLASSRKTWLKSLFGPR
ncbi:MAG: alpha/beta fold hydrolase [Candidatus Lernaella stagnicola]|nr:alpha/beta fold hydrolase [Candidatus Lernaella stagnicola]